MTYKAAGWGASKWGSGIWGWGAVGVTISALMTTENNTNDSLESIINNTSGKALVISATVTLAGVDVTAHCTEFQIKTPSDGTNGVCNIKFFDTSGISYAIRESELVVSITYAFNGLTFTNDRFRGNVFSAELSKKYQEDTLSIVAVDSFQQLRDITPQFREVADVDADTAGAPIATELLANGLSVYSGTFSDYIGYFPASGSWSSDYDSSWEMIVQLANGRKPCLVVPMPSGVLRLVAYDNPIDPSFAVKLSGQIIQAPTNSVVARYNRIDITYRNATGATRTFSDSSDIATKGVQKYSTTLTMPGGASLASSFESLASALATDIFTFSQRDRYAFSTALNPFIFPGEKITFSKKSGGTEDLLLESVVDTWAAGAGYWSEWIGSVI